MIDDSVSTAPDRTSRGRQSSVRLTPTANTSSSEDSIKVICRFRPLKQNEIELYDQVSNVGNQFVINGERGTIEATVDYEKKYFTFDKVFNLNAMQAEIFEAVASTVNSILEGFNGTILAYGQTSSGKTWTMEGPNIRDTTSQGIIPRIIERIFVRIQESDVNCQFTLSVSYFEVYCEKIRDLLNPAQDNMKIRESKTEGFVIQDISEVYCTDKESVLQVIETGKSYRACAPTLMNAESSRSHSILSILINQKNEKTGRNRKGKLYLVDLAGSEKVSKTGAKGVRLEEAKNINRSLTSLGMVINALCDGSSHVPYRDSKLTRILQDSLGGNSKTTLIICCAPEERHSVETVSTLRFGERAKKIKNNAIVNEELGIPELKQLLSIARTEIAALKKQLGSGGSIDPLINVGSLNRPSTPIESAIDDVSINTPMTPLTPAANDEDDEGELEIMKVRINELEEELENERNNLKEEKVKNMALHTEIVALKASTKELEDKLVDSSMRSRHTSRADVLKGAKDDDGRSRSSSGSSGDVVSLTSSPLKSNQTQSVSPLATEGETANIVLLKQESATLRGMFETEIQALENTLSAREEATKSARAMAAEYAEKYARLKQEHDNQVARLVLKLSQEQHARTDLEDRLDAALQRLWSQPEEQSSNFLSKMFRSTSVAGERPSTKAALVKKEREMSQEMEKLQVKYDQLLASMESNKEAQRIVLETKESVMRSLLKQNVAVQQERDSLARRVEDLTTTVEQLTALLRNLQNRTITNATSASVAANAKIILPKTSAIIIGGGGGGTNK